MISVASDPTAAGGDGLDVEMFQASMGCLNECFGLSSFKLSCTRRILRRVIWYSTFPRD
jgi:hypothetical protein